GSRRRQVRAVTGRERPCRQQPVRARERQNRTRAGETLCRHQAGDAAPLRGDRRQNRRGDLSLDRAMTRDTLELRHPLSITIFKQWGGAGDRFLQPQVGASTWPRLAKNARRPPLPRPHAEEAAEPPSRSMRAHAGPVLILRDARTRVRLCRAAGARALLRMRTSVPHCGSWLNRWRSPISRCQTAYVFPFPRRIFVLAPPMSEADKSSSTATVCSQDL